ncbi:hypothetical protein KCU65_g6640, partial [Aureobasidium melanogenum]
MGKARISQGDLDWLKMYGKVIDGGSRRRPGPYPTTRSRFSKNGDTSDGHQNESIYGTDEAGTDDETDSTTDDSESDLDYQPNNHDDTDDESDLDDTADVDLWPEQFPAETALLASTVAATYCEVKLICNRG